MSRKATLLLLLEASENARDFSPRDFRKITGIGQGQVQDWDLRGYLPGDARREKDPMAERRYSLLELFYMKILWKLRRERIPLAILKGGLEELRKEVNKQSVIRSLGDPLWLWIGRNSASSSWNRALEREDITEEEVVIRLDCTGIFRELWQSLFRELTVTTNKNLQKYRIILEQEDKTATKQQQKGESQ